MTYYSSAILQAIPNKQAIIAGPLHMAPIFQISHEFIALDAYQNGFISYNYSNKKLIDRLNKCDYLILDHSKTHGYSSLSPQIKQYLKNAALQPKKIYNGTHGYWPVTLWQLSEDHPTAASP